MRLDGPGGPGSSSAHMVSVVTMVVMGMMMVRVQMRRLRGPASVGPLFLFEFADQLIVTLQLVTQKSILLRGSFLVVLEATDAVEPLQVDPPAPHHADTVHYQVRPQVHFAVFLFEITVTDVNRVVSGSVAKNELKVCASRRKCDLCMTLPTAILKAYLTFFYWSVSVASVSDLAFSAKSPEQLVVLELPLLIGHDPGHLEGESGPRLLVQAHSIEGQNTDPDAPGSSSVFTHRVHHFATVEHVADEKPRRYNRATILQSVSQKELRDTVEGTHFADQTCKDFSFSYPSTRLGSGSHGKNREAIEIRTLDRTVPRLSGD